MELLLSDTEVRVLGCLLEKEMATPDYYPLSLNALVNACNQKSNRMPVVAYTEATVLAALAGLKAQGLSWQSDADRVPKYSENFINVCHLVNREAALLCVLMLRGPQTVGELRTRTERLHDFPSLEVVANVLEVLAGMDFVVRMPRQPGCKEARYMHLLAGQPDVMEEEAMPGPAPCVTATESPTSRIAALEEECASLRQDLAALQKEFQDFKGQF
jgi:uncharacterized protein YceH (UPF0502 family)